MEFPLWAYLTCAEYFNSVSDLELARKAVHAGYDELMAHADKIGVPEWQNAYFENVYANRRLREMYVKLDHNK
jgi:hypothetical protein